MKSLIKITSTVLVSLLIASCNLGNDNTSFGNWLCGIFGGGICKGQDAACIGDCLIVAAYNTNTYKEYLITYQIESGGSLTKMSTVPTGYINSEIPNTPIITNESATLVYLFAPESSESGTITYTFDIKAKTPNYLYSKISTSIWNISGVTPLFESNNYFVVNSTESISMINISESGVLSIVGSEKVSSALNSIAYGKLSNFVVANSTQNIYSYSSDGLKESGSKVVEGIHSLNGIAINESGTLALVSSYTSRYLYTYGIAQESGGLTFVESATTSPDNIQGVAISQDGKYAYVLDYGEDGYTAILVYSIGSGGILTLENTVKLGTVGAWAFGTPVLLVSITTYKTP